MNINYLSDFKITEKRKATDALTPFRFTYRTAYTESYVASYDGEEFTNCHLQEDGSIMVVFEDHNLQAGALSVKREYFLTDSNFKDGICNLVSMEQTEIVLSEGAAEEVSSESTLLPYYTQGASAYEVAVKNGYEGSESEWVESLKAAAGWSSEACDIDTLVEALENA